MSHKKIPALTIKLYILTLMSPLKPQKFLCMIKIWGYTPIQTEHIFELERIPSLYLTFYTFMSERVGMCLLSALLSQYRISFYYNRCCKSFWKYVSSSFSNLEIKWFSPHPLQNNLSSDSEHVLTLILKCCHRFSSGSRSGLSPSNTAMLWSKSSNCSSGYMLAIFFFFFFVNR